MADDVVIEDPIGEAITNPDGNRVRGKDAVGAFYDTNIATNNLRITCEETFPSSSTNEIAHILILRSEFEGGLSSEVRGVFTYHVNDAGEIAHMRGYWNMDAMTFTQAPQGLTLKQRVLQRRRAADVRNVFIRRPLCPSPVPREPVRSQ